MFRLDVMSVSIHNFSYLMRPCHVLNSTMSCFEQCHFTFLSFLSKRVIFKVHFAFFNKVATVGEFDVRSGEIWLLPTIDSWGV